MKKSVKIKKKINNYLFDHLMLRGVINNTGALFQCLLAGAIFAFGFTCFITPYDNQLPIVTGGVSGITQNIYLVITFFNDKITLSEITSLFYFVLNIPILIFAFFKVGKKFAIYTLVNVVTSSVFVRLFPLWFASDIGKLIADDPLMGGVITRVIFGAMCTGISSALAYRCNASCGGFDVITYYFALRKSTSVGKYSMLINGTVVGLYTLLSVFKTPDLWTRCLLMMLFAMAYIFIASIVIDSINVRNKKVQVQIILRILSSSTSVSP